MSEVQPKGVEVPKQALYGLVGALVICALGMAFLLGRQTGPTAVVVPPTAASNVSTSGSQVSVSENGRPNLAVGEVQHEAPIVQTAPVVQPPVVQAAPVVQTAPVPPPEDVAAPVAAPPAAPVHPRVAPAVAPVPEAPPVAAAPPAGKPPVAAAPGLNSNDKMLIQNYLTQVETIMASATGDIGGDPSTFATSLLKQGAEGDASGFDDLIAKTRKAQSDLWHVRPPASCKEHYLALTRQLDSSLALLDKVKTATIKADTHSLTSLAAEGQKQQVQNQKLQTMTADLKQRAQ